MKYLLAQPAVLRMQWELDVVLTNIRSLDKTTPIVLLFTYHNPEVIDYIKKRYEGLEIHVYSDEREKRGYIPAVRPYLWWRYLSADPARENETYLQIDSDIIFREKLDFGLFAETGKKSWISDCSGYISAAYIESCRNGLEIIERLSHIVNLPVEVLRNIPGGGAQWVIAKPTAQLMWHTWQDCDLFYEYLTSVDSNIQAWTAEMWAQLYNLKKFGYEPEISQELDFIMSTNPVEDFEHVKILHNAGVTGQNTDLFYKGNPDYVSRTPFGDDFGYVNPQKASIKYVQAINKVVQ